MEYSKEELLNQITNLLDNRVWRTKKTRIEAEARLKLNSLLSDIIINYYTFSVLAFSIWALVLDSTSTKAQNITLSTVILSVGLFGITLLMSSIGFKQKAVQFKESYLKLDSLETEIRHLIRTSKDKDEKEIEEQFYTMEKKYNDILSLSDNHNSIDNERVVILRNLGGNNPNLYLKYYAKIAFKWIFVSALFSFPLILVFIV